MRIFFHFWGTKLCPPEGDFWGHLLYYPCFHVTFTHMQLFPNYRLPESQNVWFKKYATWTTVFGQRNDTSMIVESLVCKPRAGLCCQNSSHSSGRAWAQGFGTWLKGFAAFHPRDSSEVSDTEWRGPACTWCSSLSQSGWMKRSWLFVGLLSFSRFKLALCEQSLITIT